MNPQPTKLVILTIIFLVTLPFVIAQEETSILNQIINTINEYFTEEPNNQTPIEQPITPEEPKEKIPEVTKEITKTKEQIQNTFLKENYNQKYGIITLKNSTQNKIIEYSLTDINENCFIECYAKGKTTLYTEGTLFDTIEYKDQTSNPKSVKNQKYYLIFEEEYFEEEPASYKEKCFDNVPKEYQMLEDPKKWNQKYCIQEVASYKNVSRIRTIKQEYNGEKLPPGNYDWQLEINKKPNQKIDFIPQKENVKLNEWAWWNAAWTKKKQINITATFSDRNMTSTLLNITYDSDMQSDFDDLRFTEETESAEVGYWFYNNTYKNASWVEVWVNTSVLGSTTSRTLYMYYGNADVTTTSNISKAFWFGDDFNTNYLDLTKWNSSTYSLYNTSAATGLLTLKGTGTASQKLQSKIKFNNTYITETRMNTSNVNYVSNSIYFLGSETTTAWTGQIAEDTQPTNTFRITINNGGAGGLPIIARWFRYNWNINESAYVIGNVTNDDYRTNNYSRAKVSTTGSGGYIGWLPYNTLGNVDWIYVRKGVPTEPTVAIGGEQINDVADPCVPTGINNWNLSIYCNLTQKQYSIKYINLTSTGGLNLSGGSNLTLQELYVYPGAQIILYNSQILPQIIFS